MLNIIADESFGYCDKTIKVNTGMNYKIKQENSKTNNRKLNWIDIFFCYLQTPFIKIPESLIEIRQKMVEP